MIITVSIYGTVYDSFADSLRFAAFQVVTFITTTGYATANYENWPSLAR